MEMIVADDHIDRRMQLDTTDLGTGQISLIIDMMDVVIFDQ